MPEFLTVKQTADFFGVNPMTIYRRVWRGVIPAVKKGKHFRIYIPSKWVMQYVESN